MPVLGNLGYPVQRDGRTADRIQRRHETPRVHGLRDTRHVYHLAQGVHPCVGPAGAVDLRLRREYPAEGVLEIALNGPHLWLACEAAEISAVIREIEPEIQLLPPQLLLRVRITRAATRIAAIDGVFVSGGK